MQRSNLFGAATVTAGSAGPQEQQTWDKISHITSLFWQTHLRKKTTDEELKKYREAVKQRLAKDDEYTTD